MKYTLQMKKEKQDWMSGRAVSIGPLLPLGALLKGKTITLLEAIACSCLFCQRAAGRPRPSGPFILTKWAIQVQLPGSNSVEKPCENFSRELEKGARRAGSVERH